MKIRTHRYQLPWPYQTSRNHSGEGALIEVEVEGTRGYADLHPWPSMGDTPIAEQIERLKLGNPTSQAQITLAMARRDANARATNQQGVAFKNSITAHKLVFIEDLSANLIEPLGLNQIIQNQLLKLKISPTSIQTTTQLLEHTADRLPKIKWRLDANSYFKKSDIMTFWQNLSTQAKQTIQYIEDPSPYNLGEWSELEDVGIPLAIDFEISKWQKTPHNQSPTDSKQTVFILKPAIQSTDLWINWLSANPHRFVVTNYLDHPIGLLHAIWAAETMNEALPSLNLPCGFSLSVEDSYLKHNWPGLTYNDFEAKWNGLASPGIGFQSQLENLNWTDL